MPLSTSNRRKGFASKRAALTVVLALAALAAAPSMASAAGKVSSDGTTITYTDIGTANNVTVTHAELPAPTYTFAEAGITVGPGCTAVGATATCPDAGVTSVVANMGAGLTGDVFNATGVNTVPFTINGEADNDLLTGSVQGDTISGGASQDGLTGGPGNDTLNGGANEDGLDGGAGNDRLEGGLSTDELNGGPDIDRVLYTACTGGGVTVTIGAGVPFTDGGCTGAGTDEVAADVESITGSNYADTITGSCLANTIAGEYDPTDGSEGGDDTINGDPDTCPVNGGDFMGGGEGNDVFNGDGTAGAAGFDTVTYGFPYTGVGNLMITIGGAADDDGWGNTTEDVQNDIERVIGNAGNDTIDATGYVVVAPQTGVQLFGRLGDDTLIDGPGNDTLNGEGNTTALPGDTINCPNGGTDVALNEETLGTGCES